MTQQIIPNDVYVAGNLSSQTFTPAAGSITDAAIVGAAGIQASKVVHQNPGITSGVQLNGPTTVVASVTQTLGMAQAPGVLLAFGCWIEVVGSGGGMSVTVDLQKSTGTGAYATVLTAVITLVAATAVRTLAAGTILTSAYVAGDIFRAVVVATAGGGTLPQGLALKLETRENPQ